jgi:hypothetical protein
MRNEEYAIDCIQSYELAMSDPWRNDFSDDGMNEDNNRWDRLVEDVMHYLNIDDYLEAIKFIRYYQNSY